ncbi:hypothetical protein [Pseudomonas sp. O230]|uniref:hypothetical protein n=1 Tax=Pseudomonas sp. O230 TaxID=3159450 RepID=UPI00387B13A4
MRIVSLSICLKPDYTEHTKSIITRYWDRYEEGLFIEDVVSIGKETGESPAGLLEYVRKHSTARLQDVTCPSCAGAVYVDCRSSYLKHMRDIQRPCDSCLYGPQDEDEDEDEAEAEAEAEAEGGIGFSNVDERLSESQDAGQCSADMEEHVLMAKPVKVFSGLMIDLSIFSASPAEAVAACQGATLAVVKDGVPLFYCVSPDVMAKNNEKDASTS